MAGVTTQDLIGALYKLAESNANIASHLARHTSLLEQIAGHHAEMLVIFRREGAEEESDAPAAPPLAPVVAAPQPPPGSKMERIIGGLVESQLGFNPSQLEGMDEGAATALLLAKMKTVAPPAPPVPPATPT